MNTERGVVLVLAAGRGSRMGCPKALMQVDGRAWWRTQVERIAAAGRHSVWVVGPAVRGAIDADRAAPSRLVDGDADAPMFASVLRGIEAMRVDSAWRWLHVLPVDVPAPTRATFDALEREAVVRGVTVPSHRGATGHPICLARAWIDRVVMPAVGSRSLAELRLDALTAPDRAIVEVDDADVCVNLNTPEALAAWCATRRSSNTRDPACNPPDGPASRPDQATPGS